VWGGLPTAPPAGLGAKKLVAKSSAKKLRPGSTAKKLTAPALVAVKVAVKVALVGG